MAEEADAPSRSRFRSLLLLLPCCRDDADADADGLDPPSPHPGHLVTLTPYHPRLTPLIPPSSYRSSPSPYLTLDPSSYDPSSYDPSSSSSSYDLDPSSYDPSSYDPSSYDLVDHHHRRLNHRRLNPYGRPYPLHPLLDPSGVSSVGERDENVGSLSITNLQINEECNGDPDIIRLEKHGIEVRIPRNEAYSTKDVIVNAITKVPPELLIKENEAIITVGLEMRLPSNAVFGNPVKVTMPHCGGFTKPENVKIVSYYRRSASKQFVAIPFSVGVNPRCDVRHNDLDIYFNHFSEYWIVAILEEVFIGKRVICTPYVPLQPPKNNLSILHLQVRDANEHEEEDVRDYTAPLRGEQFFFKWSSGSMNIYCPESTNGDAPKIIEKSDVRHLTRHTVMFLVDTSKARDDRMIVTFILEQSTRKELLINMKLIECTASLSNVSPVQSAISYGMPTSETVMAPSTSTSVPTQDDCQVHRCQERKITDDLLNRLAKDIPSGNYYDLCGKLEYGYDQAKNILDKSKNDYAKATRECLAGWINKATRSLADLHKVLFSAGLGGKIDHTR